MNHFQVFFTSVLTPMVFFSGLMFPVQELPVGLRTATYLTPMFHAIETVRLLGWGSTHASVPWAWACPVVLLAFAVALGWAGVRAMVRRMH